MLDSPWGQMIERDLLDDFFNRKDLIRCPINGLNKPITPDACKKIRSRPEFKSQGTFSVSDFEECWRPLSCGQCSHNPRKGEKCPISVYELREERKKRGLSQKTLGKILGVSTYKINSWEQGRQPIQREYWEKIKEWKKIG